LILKTFLLYEVPSTQSSLHDLYFSCVYKKCITFVKEIVDKFYLVLSI